MTAIDLNAVVGLSSKILVALNEAFPAFDVTRVGSPDYRNYQPFTVRDPDTGRRFGFAVNPELAMDTAAAECIVNDRIAQARQYFSEKQ